MRNPRGSTFLLAITLSTFQASEARAQEGGGAAVPQATGRPYVRLVLFTPSDVAVPAGVRKRMTQIADTTDAYLQKWMKHWGYPAGVKSIFRRESDGLAEVLTVRGELPVASGKYSKPNYSGYVIERAAREYRAGGSGVVWWIFVYLGDRPARFNDYAGFGNPKDGGWAMVNYDTLPGDYRPDLGPAEGFNGQCFLKGSLHELGHAFGLGHAGPELALDLGNSLMGPTNMLYASRKLPRPDQAYLAESSAAMLWKHPIFSGAGADRPDVPNARLADYQAVFDRSADAVTVTGRLVSNRPAHTAILIDDRGEKDEYWFPSYVGRLRPDGTFRIRIDKPARASGRYRFLFCFDNGVTTGNGAAAMYTEQGYTRRSYRFLDGDFQFSAPVIAAGMKFAAPFRDDFDGPLQPGWRLVNPKGDGIGSLDARKGFFRIAAKSYHDLWTGSGDYNAPRLMREADGDFTLETRVSGPGRWCGGLLVWKDEDNFVRLDRGIRFRNEISLSGAFEGEYASIAREYVEADPLWLRLARAGYTYTASYSFDGKQWLPLKRTYVSAKQGTAKVAEDAMSLLKENDFTFREAATSLEMRVPGPLLVGITDIVPAIPLPYGVTQTATDYDYFAILGK